MNFQKYILLFICCLLFALNSGKPVYSHTGKSYAEAINPTAVSSWIVKWKHGADPSFLKESEVVTEFGELGIVVARPKSPRQQQSWLDKWSASPAVDYLQPETKVQVTAVPTDPLLVKQKYLQQIHAEEAWNVPLNLKPITVAIVDTGVDLKHPDLEGRIGDGINLLYPSLPPKDDNGHGTNVAGIIAANANNDKGIAGIAANARIMPIKALEADGTGGEAKLGEGIRYAVNHGAKIVVLSLGLNKYSPFMNDMVKYADEKGVLIVAAAGNEGMTVKYPAAYPTVMAVGGVTADLKADPRSNSGPELDIVAPWDVFTTAMGGGYEYKDGTSMAAPQVAAAAALAWSKYPDMTPAQIRNLLRQTAQDIGEPGWDSKTGYGLLRADRALTQPYTADMYEDNNSIEKAKALSINMKIDAEFSSPADEDWFRLESDYNGTVQLQLVTIDNTSVQITYYASGDSKPKTYFVKGKQTVSIPVSKGKGYLMLQLGAEPNPPSGQASAPAGTASQGKPTARLMPAAPVPYSLITSFTIGPDAFSGNDRQAAAYTLPPNTKEIKGTFEKADDQDWYKFVAEKSGTLRVKVSTDTGRMDPVLYIQPKGGKPLTIDQGGDGVTETSQLMNILPGEYYIRVSNAQGNAVPITGQYTLSLEYNMKYIDPNEPNDKPYQATTVGSGTEYKGILDTVEDEDWFRVALERESLLEVNLGNIPAGHSVAVTVYDRNINPIKSYEVKDPQWQSKLKLSAGDYYVKLHTDTPFDNQIYLLKADIKPLFGGYVDVAGHWAANAILELTAKHLVKGQEDLMFHPDKEITRAEALTILVDAFALTREREVSFSDVPRTHWAYDIIARAVTAGITKGYPDGTLVPDEPINRLEMAQLLANCLNYKGKYRGFPPFNDIPKGHPGEGILKQLKAEGWIKGFPDGTFRPTQHTTRAEFVLLLTQILRSGKGKI